MRNPNPSARPQPLPQQQPQGVKIGFFGNVLPTGAPPSMPSARRQPPVPPLNFSNLHSDSHSRSAPPAPPAQHYYRSSTAPSSFGHSAGSSYPSALPPRRPASPRRSAHYETPGPRRSYFYYANPFSYFSYSRPFYSQSVYVRHNYSSFYSACILTAVSVTLLAAATTLFISPILLLGSIVIKDVITTAIALTAVGICSLTMGIVAWKFLVKPTLVFASDCAVWLFNELCHLLGFDNPIAQPAPAGAPAPAASTVPLDQPASSCPLRAEPVRVDGTDPLQPIAFPVRVDGIDPQQSTAPEDDTNKGDKKERSAVRRLSFEEGGDPVMGTSVPSAPAGSWSYRTSNPAAAAHGVF